MFVRSAFYLFWRWFGALCVLLLSDLYGGTNDDANSDGMWFGFLLFMVRSDCHLVWNFLSSALFECVSCKIYFLSLFFVEVFWCYLFFVMNVFSQFLLWLFMDSYFGFVKVVPSVCEFLNDLLLVDISWIRSV